MSNENHDNPVANGLLILVLLGAVGKCASDTAEKLEPKFMGFFHASQVISSSYIVPFLGAAILTGFILTLLCKLPRRWKGSHIDFRFSVTGVSVISALVLFFLGIPKPENIWMFSFWAGILFGGPLYFWFHLLGELPFEEERLQKIATEPLEEKINALNTELATEENRSYRQSLKIRELETEVEKLQNRDKFLTKKEKDESGEKSILKSDDSFWRGTD